VNAKDRLRQYLEQRRDAGETELVLDTMSVDDVMRLLGAPGGAGPLARGADTAAEGRAGLRERGAMPREREVSAPEAVREAVSEGSAPLARGDWREALRATEGAGGEGKEGRRPEALPARPVAARSPQLRTDAERAPSPSSEPAPVPEGAGVLPPESMATRDDTPARPSTTAGPVGQDDSHATMPLERVPTGLVVGSPAHEMFGGPGSPYATLDDIAAAVRSCERCSLHRTARQGVPGEGNPDADFVCVGEAPGANEDEQGRPFVGQAGQLLTRILAAINLSREEVFICNVLKHRPPGNRNPQPDEVTACSPYLVRQIELLQPKVIVALGTFAAQTLLQTREPIGRLRGKIHRYYGVPLIVTYHPAALLRNPSWKRPTWEDVQLARRLFDRARSA